LLKHHVSERLVHIAARFGDEAQFAKSGKAAQRTAQPVGDPDVALTVDAEAAAAIPSLECFNLGRIGRRKAHDEVAKRIGHPYPVLLVDSEVERAFERFAGLGAVALANQFGLGQVTFGKVDELVSSEPDHPDVAAWRNDNALHQAELAIESDALGRRQRLAVLVENGNGLAAVTGEPGIVVRVDRSAESAAPHAATGEARGHRRKRTTIRGEFAGAALSERFLRLPACRTSPCLRRDSRRRRFSTAAPRR
jgi:hypothetical protein